MRNFKESEFIMGDKPVFKYMNEAFLYKLDLLRDKVGKPLTINSSFRDIEYNKHVGGSKHSMNLTGQAVDLRCSNSFLRVSIVKEALLLGLSVGVSKSFVHVDNRDNQLMFTY